MPPFDAALVGRLLDAMEHDVLPLTEAGVAAGNKVFGAAAAAAQERIHALEARYAALSARYQASKADNAIPLR